jgi:hypothetical protein
MLGKTLPMLGLFESEHSPALTEGAGIRKRPEKGIPDEFGFIGETIDKLGQRMLDFEGDEVGLWNSHAAPPSCWGKYILQSITSQVSISFDRYDAVLV